MTVELGASLRTTLPLGLDALADYDSGRWRRSARPLYFLGAAAAGAGN
jgi:hypothetical protein